MAKIIPFPSGDSEQRKILAEQNRRNAEDWKATKKHSWQKKILHALFMKGKVRVVDTHRFRAFVL